MPSNRWLVRMPDVDLVTGADCPPPRGETAEEKDLRLAKPG